MSEFKKACRADEIEVGKMKPVEIDGERIVIARTESGYFAVIDECTHDSAPISDGRVRGEEIMCKRHGARFALATGDVTAPPAVAPLDVFEVKEENGEILVRLDD